MTETQPGKARSTSIHCDKDLKDRFAKVVKEKSDKSLTQEWKDMMLRRLVELEGQPNSSANSQDREQEYEKLKIEHLKLIGQVQNVESTIRRDSNKSLFNSLNAVSHSKAVGLNADLSNLENCIPRLFEQWVKLYHGREVDAHIFVTYLEVDRKRLNVEKRLKELRFERSNTGDTGAAPASPRGVSEKTDIVQGSTSEPKTVEAETRERKRLEEEERERKRKQEEAKRSEEDDWSETDDEGDKEEEDLEDDTEEEEY